LNLADFVLHWTFCLFSILAAKKISSPKRAAVLVFGVGEEGLFVDGDDRQFVNYCRAGPIEPLRSNSRFLIQSISIKVASFNPDFAYSRRPLIDLVRESPMGLVSRLKMLWRHLTLLFSYLFAVCRLPQLSLIGKDIAYTEIAFGLDQGGFVDAIILTCSSFSSQPIWGRVLRRAKVHMIWYAQNWKPVIFEEDKIDSDIPFLRWIRVDTHWVWTRAFGNYLAGLTGSTAVNAVGPIVWRLPEKSQPSINAIEIAVFDISPYDDVTALFYGEAPNYNHPSNMFAFIGDILSLKFEMEKIFDLTVIIRLKTKRGYTAAYDKGYFDFLESLHTQGSIVIEHHSVNLYSLISRSHLVIAYPFTSPPYIADELNVTSIFYDPTNSICRYDFGDASSKIKFAANKKMLAEAAISALLDRFPKKSIH
jgi:polysaccharide biosynthesis PFTS motif protein